ncbi:MAG: replication initiator protein [Microviridae sp.]|nr:MAG: replication initiator protein [Microviridae sp.]
MACLYPLKGWRSYAVNPKTGKRSIVFGKGKMARRNPDDAVQVPCGRCIDCRLEHSRQWAIRCEKEAELYDQNCVITLTYDSENLPKNGSIEIADAQKFMKRLREKYEGKVIRSFGCAEYGEKGGRPHYHLLLFNHEFEDKKLDLSMQGLQPEHKYWTSEILDQLWGMGRTQIMPLNFETAAYVARYVMKKIKSPGHTRTKQDPGSLKFVAIADERSICVSRRPGVAADWYKRYKHGLCNSHTIFSRGRSMATPTFFNRRMEIDDPSLYQKIKYQKKLDLKKYQDNLRIQHLNGNHINSAKLGYRPRIEAETICKRATINHLKRGLR